MTQVIEQLAVERWDTGVSRTSAQPLREADLWWDRFGRTSGRDWDVSSADGCLSSVEVIVNHLEYVFVLWLPDQRAADLRVVVHDHELHLDGRQVRRERLGIVVHRVCSPSGFIYCATVPAAVDIDRIDACLHEGLFIVRVPVRPR